jgi:BASS family bile acid:Na+ symporter
MKIAFRLSLGLAFILALAVLGMFYAGNFATTGPLVLVFFCVLAVAFRLHPSTKGFSFGMVIFAMVALGMYYPSLFIEYQGFQLSVLIIPLIQVIMFGMGTSMSLSDFIGVARMPKGVLIGVVAQFTIMPTVGFVLAYFSQLPSEIAAGIILLGCAPGGMASNVMAYLAKANLALSITLTAFSTLLSPFFTPFLMKVLGGEFIEIDVLKMMGDIIKMVIIPIGAGLLVNKILEGRAAWLQKLMPTICMVIIGIVIVLITATGRDSLLEVGLLLIFLALIHNLSGFTLGYWFARLVGMNEKDCRTVALEVGMQNGGMALGLAKEMGKVATLGLAGIVFSSLHNVTGSILASYWHNRDPKDNSIQ